MPSNNEVIIMKFGLKSEYDSLDIKNLNTLYFCTDTLQLYLGDDEYTKTSTNLSAIPTSGIAGVGTIGEHGKLYFCTEDNNLYLCRISNDNLVPTYNWIIISNKYTHPDSGISEGTYNSVQVDKQGHVVSGSNPTTLSGYNITDAYTNKEVDNLLSTSNNLIHLKDKDESSKGLTISVKNNHISIKGTPTASNIIYLPIEDDSYITEFTVGNKYYMSLQNVVSNTIQSMYIWGTWSDGGSGTTYQVLTTYINSNYSKGINIQCSTNTRDISLRFQISSKAVGNEINIEADLMTNYGVSMLKFIPPVIYHGRFDNNSIGLHNLDNELKSNINNTVPNTRTISGKSLDSDITLTTNDITSLQNYSISNSYSELKSSDTLNVALGKLGRGIKDLKAIALTNTDDLNNITTVGSYYAAGSNTVANKPTDTDAFGLIIYRVANGYYVQELIEANKYSRRLYRKYINNKWSDWLLLPCNFVSEPIANGLVTANKFGYLKTIKFEQGNYNSTIRFTNPQQDEFNTTISGTYQLVGNLCTIQADINLVNTRNSNITDSHSAAGLGVINSLPVTPDVTNELIFNISSQDYSDSNGNIIKYLLCINNSNSMIYSADNGFVDNETVSVVFTYRYK